MMNYEMFKGIIENELVNFLDDDLKDCKVVIEKVNKVNVTKDGVRLAKNDSVISPTLYLDDMFEHYKKCESLPDVMKNIADVFKRALTNGKRFEDINLQGENVKKKIVFQLINAELNKELIENCPHRSFKDLEVIYRIYLEKNENGVMSSIINNSLANALGLSEQELFDLAVENTRRINPVKITNMNVLIKELFSQQGMPDEMMDIAMQDLPIENPMYIISNESGMNGAVSMMYEDDMHNLAEKLNDDLYILPSSVHEVIAVPAKSFKDNPEYLTDMVYQVNMGVLDVADRLSNEVYFYDKELRTLDLATDTPKRSLGDDVGEKSQEYVVKPKKL